jgi:hypothetical protein
MRTLLQSIPTGLYFKAGGEWTPHSREAFDFEAIQPALAFAHRAGLKRVHLAFAFGDPPYTTGVPLEKSQPRIG